jgi:hypothetical protein
MKKNTLQFLALSITIIGLIYVSIQTKPQFVSTQENDTAFYSTKNMLLDYNLCREYDAVTEVDVKKYSPKLGKSLLAFKEALGFRESRGNYFIVNEYGYLGKYQFGLTTLQALGITDPTVFLQTPKLQEEAFYAFTARNKWILRNYIERYAGKTINGVKVTESGILAAAHLGGAGSVKKWLRSHGAQGFSDAFGSSVRNYMKRFSGFDTSKIEANRKAQVKLKA